MERLVLESSESNSDGEKAVNPIELIALGKRAGLDLFEINEFTVSNLFEYVDIVTGKVEKSKTKEATQADIDKFLA